MILSMTGYGKGSAGNDKITAEVELRSINSRYLDIFLKLPSAFSTREFELREFIKSKIKRGKINITVVIRKNGVENGIPVVDKEKLKSLISFVKELKKTAKL